MFHKLRRLGPAVTTVAAGVVLTLGGTGIAVAASSGGQPAQGPATSAAVSHTHAAASCRSLFAVVNKAGVLQRASCSGISSKLLGTPGHFQVLFPRNVRHCAYVATIGNAGSKGLPTPGVIGVAGRTGHTNGVFVETFDTSGNPTSIGFHLVVTCP